MVSGSSTQPSSLSMKSRSQTMILRSRAVTVFLDASTTAGLPAVSRPARVFCGGAGPARGAASRRSAALGTARPSLRRTDHTAQTPRRADAADA